MHVKIILVWNLGKVPDVIDNFLETLGNAFSATALFLLGLKMVGRIKSLKGEERIIISNHIC